MTLASLLDALKPGKIQLTPEQIKVCQTSFCEVYVQILRGVKSRAEAKSLRLARPDTMLFFPVLASFCVCRRRGGSWCRQRMDFSRLWWLSMRYALPRQSSRPQSYFPDAQKLHWTGSIRLAVNVLDTFPFLEPKKKKMRSMA
jgi:hypothetical protein